MAACILARSFLSCLFQQRVRPGDAELAGPAEMGNGQGGIASEEIEHSYIIMRLGMVVL